MSPKQQVEAYAQSIYLVIKNRRFDEIEGEDGQAFVDQIIDWTTQFVDELMNTVGPDNELVDWWFARESNFELGSVVAGDASIDMPTAVDRLLTDETRYVQILQDGTAVSNWAVVHAKDISSKTNRITQDMCAVVGSKLVFSRAFKDTEDEGTIVGDVVLKPPVLSLTNVKLLSFVKPKQLLIFGVAKNMTLPDIVQGKLSPSYAQKFDTLLAGAIARSTATSVAHEAARDDYSHVRGNY